MTTINKNNKSSISVYSALKQCLLYTMEKKTHSEIFIKYKPTSTVQYGASAARVACVRGEPQLFSAHVIPTQCMYCGHREESSQDQEVASINKKLVFCI